MSKVFTTHGWLDADQVELMVSVTHENDEARVERTDKYVKATGEWVGNDLNVVIKKGKVFEGFSGVFA